MQLIPFLMKKILSVMFTVGLAVSAAKAQIVAIYEITNNSTIPTTFSGVTGTAFTPSPDLGPFAAANNVFSVSVVNSAKTPATAVAANQYFEFTITPPANGKLHFTALTFEASKELPNSTGRGWVVRSSIDGFASNLGTEEIIGPAPTWTDFTVDLPASSFRNVADPVTFRIYTYAANQVEFVDYDNIFIFATVDAAPVVYVTTGLKVKTTRGRFAIKGTATDDSGIASVTVNGLPANGLESWRKKIRIKPGLNRIPVVVTDDGGTATTQMVRIRRPRV